LFSFFTFCLLNRIFVFYRRSPQAPQDTKKALSGLYVKKLFEVDEERRGGDAVIERLP
jgi:hypothetical protein